MSGSFPRTGISNTSNRANPAISSGPIPLGGSPARLPTVTNPNLPPNIGTSIVNPPGGLSSTLDSNYYAIANTTPAFNAGQVNLAQNQIRNAQDEANQRRLTQLEDENLERRNATANLTQLGTQLLQGQMDVQQQVLHYQFMLEQCMETLDHQNYVLNEQAEELALLRAKMRHFEYLMDALKLSKDGNNLLRSMSGESCFMGNNLLCCRDPLSIPAPSTSPFFAGGPTRITASTFQPFNPRYRSPNTRAAAAASLNERRSVTASTRNRNLPTSNERPSRRLDNSN